MSPLWAERRRHPGPRSRAGADLDRRRKGPRGARIADGSATVSCALRRSSADLSRGARRPAGHYPYAGAMAAARTSSSGPTTRRPPGPNPPHHDSSGRPLQYAGRGPARAEPALRRSGRLRLTGDHRSSPDSTASPPPARAAGPPAAVLSQMRPANLYFWGSKCRDGRRP